MATKDIVPQTVYGYQILLETCQPFIQANYGDGEWSCILGYEGQNAQGGCYTPEIRKALVETLKEPRFTYYGWNPGKKLYDEARQWLADNNVRVRWVQKEILANANCQGQLGPLLLILQKRNVLLLGPKHLQDLQILKHNAFVEVPLPNAFTAIKDTIAAVVTRMTTTACDCLLFCSGMAGKPTMWRLAPLLPPTVTMLDMGAIFDPYVGILSRGAYRNPKSFFSQRGLDMNLEAIGMSHLAIQIRKDAKRTSY